MDGPREYHTNWAGQRQLLYDITYMWNLKTNRNESICIPENKFMVTKGERE